MSGSFLEEIAPLVRRDAGAPAYEDGVPARPPARRPSLRRAVERERAGGALVVEYKRASPGAAPPLPAPRSVDEFARATDVAGVAGYSCLATAARFDGSPGRVAELAARTSRPVLFKEFVLGPRQIEVAARTGAAAVLLIARLETAGLLARPLGELARLSRDAGLEVLLELHDPAELSRADGVPADVYGVNARDLATLRLDRVTAARTLAAARGAGLRPLLGLSGVERPEDARRFWDAGCDGILVGSAVARSAAPGPFLASLRRPTPGAA